MKVSFQKVEYVHAGRMIQIGIDIVRNVTDSNASQIQILGIEAVIFLHNHISSTWNVFQIVYTTEGWCWLLTKVFVGTNF